MSPRKPYTDEEWESDPVWALLDRAKPRAPSGRFVDDTVRAARLSTTARPLAGKFRQILLFSSGLAGAAAAVMISLWMNASPIRSHSPVSVGSTKSEEIQEIAETELLSAVVDHMDDFSDGELVSLIGF